MQSLEIRSQTGFTLLELVLVLFLIGLLASAGLLFTENQEDQAYFDETQRRMKIIQDAIIRTGENSINGQPELAGFAVDNGRLPYCLEELLFVDTTVTSGVDYISPCNTDLTVTAPGITDDGIRYGWWGPYIQIQPERDGARRFRDGYQNSFDIVSTVDPNADATNFGWVWTLAQSDATAISNPITASSPMAFTLTVSSVGYDITQANDNYGDMIIGEDDWLTDDTYTVRFYNTSSASSITTNSSDEWTLTLANSASKFDSQTFTLATSSVPAIDDGSNAVDETATFSERIPAGHYLVSLSCENSTNPCVATENVSRPYRVIVLPRQQLAPIRWNVKPR